MIVTPHPGEARERTVLIVAAHPDDEVLGAGGTVARHAAAGDKVYPLILAEGATARGSRSDIESMAGEVSRLRDQAAASAEALGAQPPSFAGFPDNRMDGIDLLDIVKTVERKVAELQPQIVYTHFGGDLNVDHRLAYQATVTACRPVPGATVRAIYAFETVSSTEWAPAADAQFRPDRFVGISEQLDRKLAALRCYESEMRPAPHARSLEAVEALARVRGASVGLEAAEAFAVIREIDP